MILREANVADVDELVGLHRRAWLAAYNEDISREQFREVFSGNSSATVWVALHGGELLGFCECEAKGPHEVRSLEVAMLYVDPDRTGEGIGSLLLQRAIGDAPAYVWTRPGDSQRFYEKHGFGADGEDATFAGMPVLRLVR